MSYFDNHPIIDYSNNSVRNILSRVRFSEQTRNNNFVLFPYTVREGERADTIAYDYYNNSKYAWLVWMSNDIVDPYYQFPLGSNDFNNAMKAKYGSIEKAQRVIVGFKTNWEDDFSSITIGQYESFPASSRKYWTPEFDINSNIFGYVRSKADLFAATNQILQLTTTAAVGFIEGEIVEVDNTNYATVIAVSGTTILLQHLIGQIQESDVLTGTVSGLTATVDAAVIAQQVIPLSEYVYWKVITAFDYHEQRSLDSRNIKLLSSTFKSNAERQMFDLLNFK